MGRERWREGKGWINFSILYERKFIYITNCYIFGVSSTAVQFNLQLTQKLVIKNGEQA